MSDVNLTYTKNDFLYYKHAYYPSGTTELGYTCSDTGNKTVGTLAAECQLMQNTNAPGPCNQQFADNICKNKKIAERLVGQSMAHSGSDELYNNTMEQYNIERLNFANLGIGVILGGIFLFKYNSTAV